jgi:hypothetical protein
MFLFPEPLRCESNKRKPLLVLYLVVATGTVIGMVLLLTEEEQILGTTL